MQCSKSLFFLVRVQRCVGIANWQYYPCVKCVSTTNEGVIRTVFYQKTRNDTILRVAFNSPIANGNDLGCSEWFIKFNGRECTAPAPISSSVTTFLHQPSNSYHWDVAPAEISGYCSATSKGKLTKGGIVVSVHVRPCTLRGRHGDAHTGPAYVAEGPASTTSSIVVEEYCDPWMLFHPLELIFSLSLSLSLSVCLSLSLSLSLSLTRS